MMKKFTLLIVLVFTIQLLFSQTVLTSSNNFSIGDTYCTDSYIEATDITPGADGANCTWDYSTISTGTYTEGQDVICVNPASTPFADSAAVANANICLRNIDNPDEGFYQYFNCNTTSQSLLAFGLNSSGGSFCNYYNPLTTMEFPFSYGDNFDDSWEALMYSYNMGYYYYHDSSFVTADADAYGTITTPAGEFQNVLRIKRTTLVYSWYNYSGTEWTSLGSFTDIQYDWYAPDIKIPVMSMYEAEWLPGTVNATYLVEHSFTGIDENTIDQLQVFPNPTQNKTIINSEKKFNTLKVFSLNGQQLDLISTSSRQYTLDLSQYPRGIFLIELTFEDSSVERERIIKY